MTRTATRVQYLVGRKDTSSVFQGQGPSKLLRQSALAIGGDCALNTAEGSTDWQDARLTHAISTNDKSRKVSFKVGQLTAIGFTVLYRSTHDAYENYQSSLTELSSYARESGPTARGSTGRPCLLSNSVLTGAFKASGEGRSWNLVDLIFAGGLLAVNGWKVWAKKRNTNSELKWHMGQIKLYLISNRKVSLIWTTWCRLKRLLYLRIEGRSWARPFQVGWWATRSLWRCSNQLLATSHRWHGWKQPRDCIVVSFLLLGGICLFWRAWAVCFRDIVETALRRIRPSTSRNHVGVGLGDSAPYTFLHEIPRQRECI